MKYFLILFIFRIKTIIKTLGKLEDNFALKPKTLFFINLGKLLGFVIMMAHFYASLWLYIGNYEI